MIAALVFKSNSQLLQPILLQDSVDLTKTALLYRSYRAIVMLYILYLYCWCLRSFFSPIPCPSRATAIPTDFGDIYRCSVSSSSVAPGAPNELQTWATRKRKPSRPRPTTTAAQTKCSPFRRTFYNIFFEHCSPKSSLYRTKVDIVMTMTSVVELIVAVGELWFSHLIFSFFFFDKR